MDDRIKPTLWDRTRWPRYAFVAGVLVGSVAGWFFHQVVSLLMGASVMLIVLVPLLIIGFLWWRTRSHGMREHGPTVVRWRYDTAIGAPRIDPASSYRRRAVYDPFAGSGEDAQDDDTGCPPSPLAECGLLTERRSGPRSRGRTGHNTSSSAQPR